MSEKGCQGEESSRGREVKRKRCLKESYANKKRYQAKTRSRDGGVKKEKAMMKTCHGTGTGRQEKEISRERGVKTKGRRVMPKVFLVIRRGRPEDRLQHLHCRDRKLAGRDRGVTRKGGRRQEKGCEVAPDRLRSKAVPVPQHDVLKILKHSAQSA